MKIKDYILKYIRSEEYVPKTREQLGEILNISKKDNRIFYDCLNDLIKDGEIRISKKNRYVPITDEDKRLVGNLQGNQKGFAFFISDDINQKDVYIAKEDLNGALNKDKVRIQVKDKSVNDNESAEGKVVEIIKRNTDNIVGTYSKNKTFGFVIPDEKNYFNDIFISKNKDMKAKDGYKVICKIDKFSGKNPEGHIIEVLGDPNDKGVDILSIIKSHGIPNKFSSKTIKEAKNIKFPVSEDFKNRKDLRDLFTVTIDGEDAKDFDDAISIEKKEDNFILYVHIADVTHYVKEGSSIDKEAYERGNSVYLIDKVVPMLPFELSNEVCSLKPNENRLTLTLKMEIDKSGKVINQEFFEAVIKSDYRLVYEDVSDYIEDGIKYEDEKLNETLDNFNELYEILNKAKNIRGAIDFNVAETEIFLNDEGHPVYVGVTERRVANRMIEEFMLITNETVATFFSYLDWPFIYRVHEKPDEEKIIEFKEIVGRLGYVINGKKLYPKDFQKLIEKVKGKSEELMINNLMLRSMQKAKYSTKNEGHFGLALKDYTHFTAPIRRYSDLIVHRIMKNWIGGLDNKRKISESNLVEIADHCSYTEMVAQEIEREVIDVKSCEYMEDYIGEKFTGIITSLTNFGIFVQLESSIEILVHFRNMNDDYYTFNEKNYEIIGERLKKVYRIGQKVKVQIVAVNTVQSEIDGIFVE